MRHTYQRRQKQYENHCYQYIRTRPRQGTGVLYRKTGVCKKGGRSHGEIQVDNACFSR